MEKLIVPQIQCAGGNGILHIKTLRPGLDEQDNRRVACSKMETLTSYQPTE